MRGEWPAGARGGEEEEKEGGEGRRRGGKESMSDRLRPVAKNRENLALGAKSALLAGELDALEKVGEVCPFGIEHGGGAGEREEPGALLASSPGDHGAATRSGHLHDRDGGAAPDRLDASGEILGDDRGEPGLLVPAVDIGEGFAAVARQEDDRHLALCPIGAGHREGGVALGGISPFDPAVRNHPGWFAPGGHLDDRDRGGRAPAGCHTAERRVGLRILPA